MAIGVVSLLLAGGTNLYAYVDGNPVNAVDPRGQYLNLVTGGIGALASGGGNLEAQLINNGWRWECVDKSDVVIATLVGFAAGYVAPTFAMTRLGAVGLGTVASVAQTGASNLANGKSTSGWDLAQSAGLGADSGLITGGVGKPPSGYGPGSYVHATGVNNGLTDRLVNEGPRIRSTIATSNGIRSLVSGYLGNSTSGGNDRCSC